MNRVAIVFCTWMLIGLPSSSLMAQPVAETKPIDQAQATEAETKPVDQTGVIETETKSIDQAAAIEARFELAGENRSELEQAIELAPEDQRTAVEFLILNMGQNDLQTLTAEFLLDNVRVAYEARAAAPWAAQVSDDLFFNDILPYANVDETRESWRAKLRDICLPIVEDCKTTGEAALKLNRQLFKKVKVKFSFERKKINQSPSESIDTGMASCTGQAILLADACRSVHVPARLTGIPKWPHKDGNHSWVEVWSDGDWHFVDAGRPKYSLDQVVFKDDALLADKSKPMNSIYSVSFTPTDTAFPMVWAREDPENPVYAINVTDRYAAPPKQGVVAYLEELFPKGSSRRLVALLSAAFFAIVIVVRRMTSSKPKSVETPSVQQSD